MMELRRSKRQADLLATRSVENSHNPLLDLPPELRNLIYYHVGVAAVQAHVKRRKAPSMFRVSRQLRQEFGSLYFADVVMCSQLKSQGDELLWQPVTNVKVLTALLGLTSADRGKHFNRAFGGKGAGSVYHTDLLPLKLGDKEEAQHAVQELFEQRLSDMSFVGALVFPKDSGLRSHYVWQHKLLFS